MLKHIAGHSGSVHPADYVHAVEYWGRKSVRQGAWKANWTNAPFGSERWELYNLDTDIGEQEDLAAKYPEKLESLVHHYEEYASESGVVEDPEFWIKYSNTINFYD